MSPVRVLIIAAIFALGAGPAHAVLIPGMYDTGIDNNGALLVAGATDPHYQLIASPDPAYPGPGAVVANPIAAGFWLANSSGSQWIAPVMAQGYPSGGTPHPAGVYKYRLEFDLTGFDLATVVVSGGCAMDNSGKVRLNDALIATNVGTYNSLTPLFFTGGFVAGVNHLDFEVTNLAGGGSNPTGVRVRGLTGSGAISTTPVPSLEFGARALLLPCSPNPFNPRTTIRFELPQSGSVQLAVFDLAGRLVRVLVETELDQGVHAADWDGRDASGRKVSSGSYVARLHFGGKVETVRMALVQ